MRQVNIFVFSFFKKMYVSPTTKQKQKGKQNIFSEESKQAYTKISTPRYCSPATTPKKELDNPRVQGIIVAIPKGGSDKYGVSNTQGAKGKINILSSPFCH